MSCGDIARTALSTAVCTYFQCSMGFWAFARPCNHEACVDLGLWYAPWRGGRGAQTHAAGASSLAPILSAPPQRGTHYIHRRPLDPPAPVGQTLVGFTAVTCIKPLTLRHIVRVHAPLRLVLLVLSAPEMTTTWRGSDI